MLKEFLSVGNRKHNRVGHKNSVMKAKYSVMFLTALLLSCSSQDKNDVIIPNSTSDLQRLDVDPIELTIINLNSEEKTIRDWWKKIKVWVNDHAGSHLFDNCSGEGGCGPCAGVCFQFGILTGDEWDVTNNDFLSQGQYFAGMRSFSITSIEHKVTGEVKLLFETEYVGDFCTNSELYIINGVNLDQAISSDLGLGQSSVEIKAGIYPMIFDTQTGLYGTILDI